MKLLHMYLAFSSGVFTGNMLRIGVEMIARRFANRWHPCEVEKPQ